MSPAHEQPCARSEPAQVFPPSGVYFGVETIARVVRPFALFESVRCLECGEVYSKPRAGGTVRMNPGCPLCGYVGWLPLTRPAENGQLRSVEGPPPPRFGPER